MGVLQVGVGLVLGVPLPVVGERDHLVGRLVRSDVPLVLAVAVLAGGVLVEVVPEVDDGVQVVALGEAAVGVEPTGLPVGAGDDPEAQVLWQCIVSRSGAGAADPAGDAVIREAVVVPGGGLQALHVDLDGVVTAWPGGELPAADDVAEPLVSGDLPEHGDLRAVARAGRAGRGRRDPGPDDHGLRLRVTGRDAVLEVLPAGRGAGRSCARADGRRSEASDADTGSTGGEDGPTGERELWGGGHTPLNDTAADM